MSKKSDKKVKNYGAAATVTGGLVTGTGLSRTLHQSKIDPNTVRIEGGSSNVLIPKGEKPPFFTVFDTQREAWTKHFRGQGHRVNEYALIDTRPTINTGNRQKRHYPIPRRTMISMDSKKAPLATIDVGGSIGAEQRTWLGRLFKGQVRYRAFSDIGPSNQHQPILDPAARIRNNMYASKNPYYTRNIVPGGDLIPGTAPASKANINILSVPTKTVGQKYSGPNLKKKPLVSVTFGSGYGWQDSKFQNKEQVFKNLMKSLDTHYGTGGYRMHVLGGPNTSKNFHSYFKHLSKTNKHVEYGRKTTQRGMMNLLTKSDVAVMAPGSSLMELASLEGPKPKVLALQPTNSTAEHFKHNTTWGKKYLHNVGEASLGDPSTENFSKVLKDLKNSNVAQNAPISFGAKDVNRIVATAKEDLELSKRFTRGALKGGLGLGTAGLAAYGFGKWKQKQSSDTTTGIGAGVAAVGVTKGIQQLKKKGIPYKDFQSVLHEYKDIKKGDVLFFQDAIMQGPVHPIMVLDNKGTKSKYIEFAPPIFRGNKGTYRKGVVEDMLKMRTHVGEKFTPHLSSSLGGIYRDKFLDPTKLDKVIAQADKHKDTFKYSPLSKTFDTSKICAKGTCVNFIDDIDRKSSSLPRNREFLPEGLRNALSEVKGPRYNLKTRVSALGVGLAAGGVPMLGKGMKDKDTRKKIIGGTAIAAGVGLSASKSLRGLTNLGTGVASNMAGVNIIMTPARIKDKLTGHKTWEGSARETALNFTKNRGRTTRALGATALLAPIAYGLKKTFEVKKSEK